MKFQMTKIAAASVLAFAMTGAHAAVVNSGGVFQMDESRGADTAGTYDSVNGSAVNTDATLAGWVDQVAGTWGVSSTTKFFGKLWTASGGQLISGAGSYSLDTATNAVTSIGSPTVDNTDGMLQFTIGANQIAGAINFAWGTTTGIRVVNVWNINNDGSLTAVVAPGMENGPFPDYNAFFNLTGAGLVAAPIPEASTYGMMLAGLGLVGGMVARRRKLMA